MSRHVHHGHFHTYRSQSLQQGCFHFSQPQQPAKMATAAVASKKLAQKLSAVAHSWVADPFRPNLQLKTFLESLAAHPRLTPQAVSATRALRDNEMAKKVRIWCCFVSRLLQLTMASVSSSIPFQTKHCILHPRLIITIVSLKRLRRAPRVSEGLGGRFFSIYGRGSPGISERNVML